MDYDRYSTEPGKHPDRGRVSKEETGENSPEKEEGGHRQLQKGLNNHNVKQMVDRHRRDIKKSVRKIRENDKTVPRQLKKAMEALDPEKQE